MSKPFQINVAKIANVMSKINVRRVTARLKAVGERTSRDSKSDMVRRPTEPHNLTSGGTVVLRPAMGNQEHRDVGGDEASASPLQSAELIVQDKVGISGAGNGC
jgi:hypothetical protein